MLEDKASQKLGHKSFGHKTQQKLWPIKLFNKKINEPIILNEKLQPRDERIIIPFNTERCSQLSIHIQGVIEELFIQELTQWLVQVNYYITSRSFSHLLDRKLTPNQTKNFTSKNIILNIKLLFEALESLDLEIKKDLMSRVDKIESKIIQEIILRYPQDKFEGGNKRLRAILQKLDNRGNDEYDFLLKNDIVFVYRGDMDYSGDVMKALNKMISVGTENFILETKYEETNFQVWKEMVEFIIRNHKDRNKERFMKGLQDIYQYQVSEEIEKIEKIEEIEEISLLKQSSANSIQHIHSPEQHSQTNQIKENNIQFNEEPHSIQDFHQIKNLKIGQKIPIETMLFSEEEMTTGQFTINNSAVVRLIAKWTFQLEEKISNPKETILKRIEKFKLKNKKLISLQNDQKQALYQAALLQKEKIEEYLEVLKDEYLTLQTLYSEEINSGQYTTDDINFDIFAAKIRQIYSQCMFKYLCRIIHSLKRISRTASELYFEKYQNLIEEDELKQNHEILKRVDLVSFRVGDLMRASYNCPEVQLIDIFQKLMQISEKKPQVLKVIRIKNRLDKADNDILLNLFFFNKVQCQLQLSISNIYKNQLNTKNKLYSSYNHFLYQLKRSFFGPIGEFACILGQHDPVVKNYLRLEKHHLILKNKQQAIKSRTSLTINRSNKLRELKQLLFICSQCKQLKRIANSQFSKISHHNAKLKSLQSFNNLPGQNESSNEQPIKGSTVRECNKCFIEKLELMDEKNMIVKIVELMHATYSQPYNVFNNHLQLWTQKIIPQAFNVSEVHKYFPKEGVLLIKNNKILQLSYFKMFYTDEYIYFSAKQEQQTLDCIHHFVKISRILKENQLIAELTQIEEKMFIFQFDNGVIIEKKSTLLKSNTMNEDEDEDQQSKSLKSVESKPQQVKFIIKETAVCMNGCCSNAPIELGNSLQEKEFIQNINKKRIRDILEENKNVLYLNKQPINFELNSIVLKEKKQYDSACKGIQIIETENCKLKNVHFLTKMPNASDLYLRQNIELSSLKGIQRCFNLKILSCNQCKIQSIKQLSNLINLQEVNLSNNKVESLVGLEKCVNLTILSCYDNLIKELDPIAECKMLQKLDVGKNQITLLDPIQSLYLLVSLSFRQNHQINTLQGILQLTKLEVLDFSYTGINHLELLENYKLIQKINCSGTKITTLSQIPMLSCLIELDLGSCEDLLEFDLSKQCCKNLEIIYLDKCIKLEKLNHIEHCSSLRILEIQKCQSLKNQEFNKIGKCKTIEELKLRFNNQLEKIDFLQVLPKLMKLTIESCEALSQAQFTILRKCNNLQILNLSNNKQISTIQFLKNCPNIWHLNLSNTSLHTIQKPLMKLRKLYHLELKSIEFLEINNFDFLKESSLQIQKILIDCIVNVKQLKGLEEMINLKEIYLGKFTKYPDDSVIMKANRFKNDLEKIPPKIKKALKFM